MENLQYGKVDLVKALDYAKRNYENKKYKTGYGYVISGKNTYWNYLSKESWSTFLSGMSESHQQQYEDGDGGELEEKNSKYGIVPPKMASYGSSSRFIYLQSKDIPNFSFEKKCPTQVGQHPANLDGYLEKGNTIYCVEAKCREIYSSHKNIKVSTIYEKVFKRIPNFSYDSFRITKDIEHRKYTFKYDEKELVHFDIKQLICHFLGITADILKNQRRGVFIRFIYLIFNPKTDTLFTKEIERYKEKIFKQYDETIEEIERFGDMKRLFETIMEYQIENLDRPRVDYSFDFKLVDQNNYIDEFNA
jgi:hypothetical protein